MILADCLFLDQADTVACPGPRCGILIARGEGQRAERRQRFGQHHPPRARPAAAVRGRKGLVAVDVHRIDAEIPRPHASDRSAEHTSALQPLMRTSYAVFCMKKQSTT